MFVIINYFCMMKILTLMLSLYVMLLNSMACADTVGFSADHDVTVTEYNYNAHVEFCGDQCSPFCACVCCVGCTSPPKVVAQPITADFTTTQFFYLDDHFQTAKYLLLQPPRA